MYWLIPLNITEANNKEKTIKGMKESIANLTKYREFELDRIRLVQLWPSVVVYHKNCSNVVTSRVVAKYMYIRTDTIIVFRPRRPAQQPLQTEHIFQEWLNAHSHSVAAYKRIAPYHDLLRRPKVPFKDSSVSGPVLLPQARVVSILRNSYWFVIIFDRERPLFCQQCKVRDVKKSKLIGHWRKLRFNVWERG